MQGEQHKQRGTTDWRHLAAAGMYQSGMLRAFQALSRHCEYASDNGVAERFRRVRKPKYVVLGYHSVGTTGFPLYCRLPRKVFAGQMRHIKRHYRVLSLCEMVEELQDSSSQRQGVVVTFDDGYLGTYTEAFPILREYGIPATVYVTAGSVESGEVPWYDRIFSRFQRAPSEVIVNLDSERSFRLTDFASRVEAATATVLYLRTLPDEERQQWCDSFERAIPVPDSELQGSMMSWDQVREMRQAGISIGCHTVSHPVLSRLSPEVLRQELVESKSLIEDRVDGVVDDFAFPFGKSRDCGTIGSKVLSALGFRTAVTTILGVNQPNTDRFRLRRMVQGDEPSIAMFAFRLQRLFFCPADEESAGLSLASGT